MSKEQIQQRLFEIEEQVREINERLKRLEDRNPVFKVPSEVDVCDYFVLKGSDFTQAANFFNFYQSKNWMVGKSKMKDWKAAARNWISKQPKKKNTIFDL